MSNTYKGYIVALRPSRRTVGKLTDIALTFEDMDINHDIKSSDFQANWYNIPTRNGNLKQWKKRNYILGPTRITTCTDLKNQGIVPELRAGTEDTSTQAGWGTITATNGNKYRLVYCYEENILKIAEYGFFDKTASMFKKADAKLPIGSFQPLDSITTTIA